MEIHLNLKSFTIFIELLPTEGRKANFIDIQILDGHLDSFTMKCTSWVLANGKGHAVGLWGPL